MRERERAPEGEVKSFAAAPQTGGLQDLHQNYNCSDLFLCPLCKKNVLAEKRSCSKPQQTGILDLLLLDLLHHWVCLNMHYHLTFNWSALVIDETDIDETDLLDCLSNCNDCNDCMYYLNFT